jgi:hypothetical protein
MQRTLIAALIAAPLAAGCGIAKEEHERLLQEARTAEKATYDAELKRMQAAHADELARREEVVKSKDTMIGGLESEVRKLGGDLDKVRGELGDRVTQLASAKSELAASSAEIDQLRRLREEAEKEAAQFRALAQKLKSMIDAGKLEVVMRKGRINLKLPTTSSSPPAARS